MVTGTKADEFRKPSNVAFGQGNAVLRQSALWWISLSGGTAAILLSSFFSQDFAPWLVGMIFPLAILCGYAFLGLRVDTIGGSRSEFADTVYYLGFLFTLITLAVALVELNAVEDSVGTGAIRSQLIYRFGLALSTTILGLAIRVWVVNLSQTPEALEQEAEELLVDKVEELRMQLGEATQGLRTFTETHYNALGLALEQSREAFEEQAQRAVSSINSIATKTEEAVDESIGAYKERMKKHIEKLELPLELLNDQLRYSIEQLKTEMVAAADEAKAVTKAKTKLAQTMGRLIKRFEIAEQNLEHFDQGIDRVSSAANEFESLANQVNAWNRSVSGGVASIGRAGEEVLGAAKGVVASFGELQSLLADTRGLEKSIESRIRTIDDFNKTNDAALLRTRQLYEELLSRIQEASNLLIRELDQR